MRRKALAELYGVSGIDPQLGAVLFQHSCGHGVKSQIGEFWPTPAHGVGVDLRHRNVRRKALVELYDPMQEFPGVSFEII